VAGTSATIDLGDNGPALSAFLYYPTDMAVDAAGNLYIADTDNDRIRAVRGPLP
jgi:DNA-binding beta-propeller fold protein YncE